MYLCYKYIGITMARLIVPIYVFVMIVVSSCYKDERVKPAQVTPTEEEEQVYLVVNQLESALEVIEDSNFNGAGPTLRLLLNPTFNKVGKFKYQLFYHNYYVLDEYGSPKNQLYESPLLSVAPT